MVPTLPLHVLRWSGTVGGRWLTRCLLLNALFVLTAKQQKQLVRPKQGGRVKCRGLVFSF